MTYFANDCKSTRLSRETLHWWNLSFNTYFLWWHYLQANKELEKNSISTEYFKYYWVLVFRLSTLDKTRGPMTLIRALVLSALYGTMSSMKASPSLRTLKKILSLITQNPWRPRTLEDPQLEACFDEIPYDFDHLSLLLPSLLSMATWDELRKAKKATLRKKTEENNKWYKISVASLKKYPIIYIFPIAASWKTRSYFILFKPFTLFGNLFFS